jgi:hypothetical protein
MTPEQKIKWLVLAKIASWEGNKPPEYPLADIDKVYAQLTQRPWDAENEIREGNAETNLKCDFSRHYESKGVASKLPDGTWVGWTYWYGGGKHGEPEAIDWMEDAYDVKCVEEQKMVTVQTFSKV